MILVSVGGSNLKEVGEALAARLTPDRHYDIITCENSSRPAEVLKSRRLDLVLMFPSVNPLCSARP